MPCQVDKDTINIEKGVCVKGAQCLLKDIKVGIFISTLVEFGTEYKKNYGRTYATVLPYSFSKTVVKLHKLTFGATERIVYITHPKKSDNHKGICFEDGICWRIRRNTTNNQEVVNIDRPARSDDVPQGEVGGNAVTPTVPVNNNDMVESKASCDAIASIVSEDKDFYDDYLRKVFTFEANHNLFHDCKIEEYKKLGYAGVLSASVLGGQNSDHFLHCIACDRYFIIFRVYDPGVFECKKVVRQDILCR